MFNNLDFNSMFQNMCCITAIISRTEHGNPFGCYKDLPVRAMESLEGQDHLLDGNYKSRKNAVQKCLLVGRGRGYAVVGIQDGGMCVGSTLRAFSKYGISHDCKSDGKGGPWASEVHEIIGGAQGTLIKNNYKNITNSGTEFPFVPNHDKQRS